MFTGLISDVGEVSAAEQLGQLKRLKILCHYPVAHLSLGASIACSGVCLTVTQFGSTDNGSWFTVDAAAETLAITNVDSWRPGTKVNLERSLKLGDELGGHWVTGHIDAMAKILTREDFDGMAGFTIEAPPILARFIAAKGSICLEGVSLTVNSVDENRFSVLLIPHTLAVTNWCSHKTGDLINLEVDIIARYAARLTEYSAQLTQTL